ncbi:MAG: helix-turn-helix domain-containing protein, partial [Kiritimatiellae bacterium]|nr:helix-turn-helix domain-containing protein [Kiritimatiellia bacterium]
MAHLTEQDRARIVSLLAERRSLRRIAQELGKSPSTIKREILK